VKENYSVLASQSVSSVQWGAGSHGTRLQDVAMESDKFNTGETAEKSVIQVFCSLVARKAVQCRTILVTLL